jgi:fatty acid synthase subunit alpha
MITNSLVKIQPAPPYTADLERAVLLNPLARAKPDGKGSYHFPSKQPTHTELDGRNLESFTRALQNTDTSGVGVDQGQSCSSSLTILVNTCSELISAVPTENPTFIERNFTTEEIKYCSSQPSPRSSFAARWVGKEAVFKALGVRSRGAGAPMKSIEILPDSSGAPMVILHGDASAEAKKKGVSRVHISLSHSDVSVADTARTETDCRLDYCHRVRPGIARADILKRRVWSEHSFRHRIEYPLICTAHSLVDRRIILRRNRVLPSHSVAPKSLGA